MTHDMTDGMTHDRAYDGEGAPLRLLPWTTPEGEPCYLSTDDPDSRLSVLADDIEERRSPGRRARSRRPRRCLPSRRRISGGCAA
ncbi:hypothetical protein AB0D04_01130 [Streptomyces sp. NPDC048483]|uniref:hypothetical protein n=1 Tax=Streptomyces sp. NPDC048483 TaxID=3154927 RepID=UPI003418FC80